MQKYTQAFLAIISKNGSGILSMQVFSCSTLQINITIEFVEMIVNNLTDIVANATEPSDQNSDNIQIVRTVIFETALLLDETMVEGNLEPQVIQMVSYNPFHYCLFKYIF